MRVRGESSTMADPLTLKRLRSIVQRTPRCGSITHQGDVMNRPNERRLAGTLTAALIVGSLALAPPVANAAGPAQASPRLTAWTEASNTPDLDYSQKLANLAHSDAFLEVLKKVVANPEITLRRMAATASLQETRAVRARTEGMHFEVVSGAFVLRNGVGNPELGKQIKALVVPDSLRAHVERQMQSQVGAQRMKSIPQCAAAWVAALAWIAASSAQCAPFSGWRAWACAVGQGLLGLMPDFNLACQY